MSSSVLFMSVSLDGYVAGPNDGPDDPGGDHFTLHDGGLTAAGSHQTEAGVLDEIQVHQVPVCCSAVGCGCSTCCRRRSSWRR